MYDYIIITPLPAFYKVNLYNEISKNKKIYVIFLGETTEEQRASDFSKIENVSFDFIFLNKGHFQQRNKIKSIFNLYKILSTLNYKKIILGGWDLLESWFVIFTNKVNKNYTALESTIIESDTNGAKALLKKFYLNRIDTVFASGSLHVKLLEELNYKNNIKVTRGVGLMNKPSFTTKYKKYEKSFLYLGRLEEVKNLLFLITIFNELKDYNLTIIGDGSIKKDLQKASSPNIIFLDSIPNKNLGNVFKNYNIFILPSISEPWGLVVEEALYFGLPVIVSQNCGSRELIINNQNGYIIDPTNINDTKKTITSINNSQYQKMIKNINHNFIALKDSEQINVYN